MKPFLESLPIFIGWRSSLQYHFNTSSGANFCAEHTISIRPNGSDPENPENPPPLKLLFRLKSQLHSQTGSLSKQRKPKMHQVQPTAVRDAKWTEVVVDCSIGFKANYDYETQPLPSVGTIMDLSFLEPIRLKRNEEIPVEQFKQRSLEKFLCINDLYIRDEMHSLMKKLISEDRFYQQVIIGSPGVGKSLLLFIAAIWRTAVRRERVIYIRKTSQLQESTSIFYFQPGDGDCKINVKFDRNFNRHKRIDDIEQTVCPQLMELNPRDYEMQKQSVEFYFFLDGPLAGSQDMVGVYDFHYLATSGGYPMPRSESRDQMEILCLGAWEREELKEALSKLKRRDSEHSDFSEIYFHTGGRIRDAYSYLFNKTKFISDCKKIVREQDEQSLQLAVTSTESSASQDSKDRIRTMFSAEDHCDAHQIIDSQFMINLLWKQVESGRLFKAYTFAIERALRSAAGCHFEEMMHSLFGPHGPHFVEDEIFRGEATAQEGLQNFDRPNLYWIPSVPNFANIDAAMFLGDTLYCFQYTIAATHAFKPNSFTRAFLSRIPPQTGYMPKDSNVVLLFVVPSTVKFSTPKSVEDITDINVETRVIRVNCESIAMVEQTQFPFERMIGMKQPAAKRPRTI